MQLPLGMQMMGGPPLGMGIGTIGIGMSSGVPPPGMVGLSSIMSPQMGGMRSNTIFVGNLPLKSKKSAVRDALKTSFSPYGNIQEVITNKSWRNRGQAWIVYDDVNQATAAMGKMQGSKVMERPVRIEYARSKSDVTAKLEGTFNPEIAIIRKRNLELKLEKKVVDLNKKRRAPTRPEGGAAAAAAAGGQAGPTAVGSGAGPVSQPPTNSYGGPPTSNYGGQPPISFAPPQHQPMLVDNSPAPPNNILFIENLPVECNEFMLSMLFQQFPGFREVRLVPGKPGIGFVEFESDLQASVATSALQNFRVAPNHLMKISFARK